MSTEAETYIPTSLIVDRYVLMIGSSKSSVGKPGLAIMLSQALATSGRKTLLYDGDLGLANVNAQLGLIPKWDHGSIIAGKLEVD